MPQPPQVPHNTFSSPAACPDRVEAPRTRRRGAPHTHGRQLLHGGRIAHLPWQQHRARQMRRDAPSRSRCNRLGNRTPRASLAVLYGNKDGDWTCVGYPSAPELARYLTATRPMWRTWKRTAHFPCCLAKAPRYSRSHLLQCDQNWDEPLSAGERTQCLANHRPECSERIGNAHRMSLCRRRS